MVVFGAVAMGAPRPIFLFNLILFNLRNKTKSKYQILIVVSWWLLFELNLCLWMLNSLWSYQSC